MAKLQPVAAFMASGQLQVCGRLSDAEVARAYRSHAVVWVHSLREGFGRCVVEGRLAGARVLATDIAEFAELRDGDVYLYKNPAGFFTDLDRLAEMTETRRALHRLSVSRPVAPCDRKRDAR